jgi:hypothetical protein
VETTPVQVQVRRPTCKYTYTIRGRGEWEVLGWEFKLELARPANVQAGDIKLRLRVRPAFKARRTRVDASIVENFIPPRQSNAMSRKTKPKTHVSFVGGSRGLFCYNTPFPSHPSKIKTTQHGSALPKL